MSILRMHHDIKPANILVFGGNQTSRYDCYFKVADLGLTQFHPTNIQSNDDSVLDVFGTRAYGGPAFQDCLAICD